MARVPQFSSLYNSSHGIRVVGDESEGAQSPTFAEFFVVLFTAHLIGMPENEGLGVGDTSSKPPPLSSDLPQPRGG